MPFKSVGVLCACAVGVNCVLIVESMSFKVFAQNLPTCCDIIVRSCDMVCGGRPQTCEAHPSRRVLRLHQITPVVACIMEAENET